MPSVIYTSSSSSSTATGPTQLRLRNRLADELGFYQSVSVTATGGNGDAARVLIADALRDDEIGYEFLGAPWVYAQNGVQAGSQRRMVTDPDGGYQGSLGGLVLSRPFAAALAAGTTVEITSPLPVKRHLSIKGLNDLINEGLARIWIEVRVSITGNGTYEYSLASYPWLTRYEQTRGIYDTVWLDPTMPRELSPYPYRIVTTGADRTLVTERPYTSADTFALAAIVRADRYLYDGSTWAYRATPGLQGDAWQAAVPEEWAVAFAMVKSLQFLTRMVQMSRTIPKEEKQAALADILDRRATWAAAARSIKENEFPDPEPEPTPGIVMAMPEPVWT